MRMCRSGDVVIAVEIVAAALAHSSASVDYGLGGRECVIVGLHAA